MDDPLKVQTRMAPQFIAENWPVVRDNAQRIVAPYADKISEILLCGCGDSYHAALGLEFIFASTAHRSVRAATAMAGSRYLIPRSTKPATDRLIVAFSASGEVARTIEVIAIARELGLETIACTSSPDSTLATISRAQLTASIPALELGPGLLTYLGSLLMGFALASALAPDPTSSSLDYLLSQLPPVLESEILHQSPVGEKFAKVDAPGPIVFLGSGPVLGSAHFAAAKVIEAAGESAWGQDVEEWAHLEYFCEPANMRTWLLSAGGRSRSREKEIQFAANALGRNFLETSGRFDEAGDPALQEALAGFLLWPAPVAYASFRARLLGEQPFRGFEGGRSRVEGGGASRIQTSRRMVPADFLKELEP